MILRKEVLVMDENKVNEMDEELKDIPVQETDGEEGVGNINISVDVVSTIAGIAASEIEGVASMYSSLAGGIAEIFSKKNTGKGVRVEMKERSVVIDLYIVVDYGVRVPELAWEIQEKVKNNIETMTGLEVEKVNIHVEGVSFEKQKPDAGEQEAVLVAETEIEEIPEPGSEDL